MKILIQNAEILDPTSQFNKKKVNILVENGVIISISAVSTARKGADKIIEGKNLKVSQSWTDMFSVIPDPGLEHKEDLVTGIQAAQAGGFTRILVLPNTVPPIDSKNDIRYLTRENGSRLVQVHPVAAVTTGLRGEELTEMIDLHQAGAIAFSDGLVPIWHTDIMLKSLQYLQKFDGLLINRPEDERLNAFGVMHEGSVSTSLGMKGMPSISEELMIARDLRLLEYSGGRLHFSNISTKDSVGLVRKAKQQGLQVTCDVAVHQLVLDHSHLSDFDTNYKVNPPLREDDDIRALVKGLKDGTIDAITSSHQPQDEESKNLEFDHAEFGMIGFQTVLPMLSRLLKGATEISWSEIMPALTSQPRKILGIESTSIAKGATADLTVFDPNEQWVFDANTNYSKSQNSPLFGMEIKGRVKAIFANKKHKIFA